MPSTSRKLCLVPENIFKSHQHLQQLHKHKPEDSRDTSIQFKP